MFTFKAFCKNILKKRLFCSADHYFSKFAKLSEKLTLYLLIRTHMCAYQRVRKVSFSENFPNLLNEWSPLLCWSKLKSKRSCLFIVFFYFSFFMGIIFCSSVALVWTFNTRGVYNFITKKANIENEDLLFVILELYTCIFLFWNKSDHKKHGFAVLYLLRDISSSFMDVQLRGTDNFVLNISFLNISIYSP